MYISSFFDHDMNMEVKMMKKILALLLCMTVFTGCSSQTDTSDDTANNNRSTDNVTENENNNNTPTNKTDDWYAQFENGLKEGNIDYSSKNVLDATNVGGVEGYRYVTDNGNIDVYRYEDGDEFERIMDEKIIGDDKKKVEVNDHMVIVSDGLSEDVLDIFRNLK